eukprot:425303_1
MLDYFLVDKENKLMKYKQEIIKYITQEQFNGYKLNKLSRKDFINQLADHLNDRKTKPLLGKLRKNVLECNLSRFTGFQRNETIQEFTQSHNKFNTTIMTVENETDAYYSFGKQYRYTKNLREHPFYVKPKFSSLKTELHEYFIQNEKQVLLERQIKTIKSFPTNLQAILTSLVKGSIFPEMKTEIEFDRESCMEIFWMDKLKNKYDLMQSLLSIEENSFQQLNSIITQLCCDLHEEAVIINFSTILFITLLRIKKRAHEELIVACTRNYINKIVADCDWDITDCDEHKSYNNECNKCSKTNVGARSIFANVNSYVDNSSKKSNQKNKSKDNDKDDNNFEHSKSAESKLNDVVNDALSICAFALDANDNLKEYSELIQIQRDRFRNNIITFLKNKDNKKRLSQSLIWNNKPSSIADCSTKHIVCIIENDLLNELKTDYIDLIPYKTSIIEYIRQKQFDGNKLKQITGKQFATSIILTKTIDVLDDQKLNEYKDKIIEYFEKNNIDDIKLKNMTKEFISDISNYCKNQKLTGSLTKLFKKLNQRKTKPSSEVIFANDILSIVSPQVIDENKYDIEDRKSEDNKSEYDKELLAQLYTSVMKYDTLKLLAEFYGLMFANSIGKMDELHILKDYKTLETLKPMLPHIETWTDTGELPELEVIAQDQYNVNTKQLIELITERFSVDLLEQLPINEIKWQFTVFALEIITEKLDRNKTNSIENIKPTIASTIKQLIDKSKTKMDQVSVKELKATWYQGINEFHEIKVNASMHQDHVLALIVYTHRTKLCTVFRGTYRQNCIDEPTNNQIQRHSAFANFARLLYESFVFYGSINAGVKTLYHGMSIPL